MSTRHIAAEEARLHDLTPEGSSGAASGRFRRRLAADGFTVDEGFRLKPGYLYTVVRAISARVNQNWDGWPSDELRKSYRTFIGKPVFVNHENHDPTKARGVVVAARYAENGMDKYIEVVQEIDANRFPKLAHEIRTGGLDSVSMGAEAGFTICSYCRNKATEVEDMCDHVLNHKGKTLTRFDKRTGSKEDVLVFESCHKISFFELSYVFEPADETAVASKVVVAGKQVRVDERGGEGICPECHRADGGGHWLGCPRIEEVPITSFFDLYRDPDEHLDPDDPRIKGANRRTSSDDLAVPAPPGTPRVPQSVIDATPVIDLAPATELDGHEATGLPKGAGKYTKEDFAASGSRKPWEAAEPTEDESDALEIEAMIHKHAGDCPPGVDCSRNMGVANGMEQITKDSPNNPVNQVSRDPGSAGGAGNPGGSTGGGTADGDGILPGSRGLYDQLRKNFPGADIGGYRPTDHTSYGTFDEHAQGALDFMTTDEAQAAKVREQAFAAGAPYVLWKQQQWDAPWHNSGGVTPMDTRENGDPTANHMNHVHIAPLDPSHAAQPTGGSQAGSGGGSAPAAQPMMQATPGGLVPAQRAAAVLNPPGLMPSLAAARTAARTAGTEDAIPGFVRERGARPIDFSKPVFVHTNRHAVNHNKKVAEGVLDAPPRTDVWSIKQDDPATGVHVRGYAPEVHLVNCRFNVQQAGAQKFKDTQGPDGTGGQRVVHAGAYGYVAPTPDELRDYSLTDYHPGYHTTFVHRDNGEPVITADHVHLTPDARMYSAQSDNWGRDHEPALLLDPPPSVGAANLHTVGGEPGDRPPTWTGHTASLKRTARRAAMKKTARSRAVRLAWGEKEAPMAVDTLREEGSAPEDDNDDFERYVDPPKELRTPDLSQGEQDHRDREIDEQGGGMGQPGPDDPEAAQQPPQQRYMTLQIPIPGDAPQVPMQAVPPQSQAPRQQAPITASMLDHFDRYFGRRVADWMDAIEARRDMTPAEAADYRRQAGRLSTLLNDRELSTTNRNPRKGTANMARNSMASRSKVATAGRRQRTAEGPLTDGGDRSRNDQGEQEEAFISQTPPEVPVDYPTGDAPNISNTEHNLVARVQRGRNQLLRDAQQLAAVQKRRALTESGGPTAVVVDPRVNSGAEAEALTGTDFVSADPNDGVVPTNPKDASLRAFKAFDGWLTSKTGKSSRRHTEANIKKAAAAFAREAGISPQVLFPALGIVLREARKNDKQANTRGAKMRKRADEKLEVAAPDGRIDVEAPVSNTTSAEAQASQFDIRDFGNNAGDDVANPDLSTDQNWAPGEASKTGSRVKTAGGLLAMRCAEGMIAAGLESSSRERKYQLAAEFEGMNRGLIQDRVALLERFAAVRQADLRRVASGSSRGAARSPIPAGLGGGTRTASAGMRTAAHDPSNDSSLFI